MPEPSKEQGQPGPTAARPDTEAGRNQILPPGIRDKISAYKRQSSPDSWCDPEQLFWSVFKVGAKLI